MLTLLSWNRGFRHFRDPGLQRTIIGQPEVVPFFLEIADHVLTCGKNDIVLDPLIPFHKDLRDERLITRGRDDKVDVRRPVRRSFGGSQKLTYGAVRRSRVGGRHERQHLKGAVFIGPETAAQIVVGLLLILVLIKAIGRGLPGIENRPLDRGFGPKIVILFPRS